MDSTKSYIKQLGITEGSTLTVNGEKSKIIIKGNSDVLWIINDTRKYIVDNIARLLMINPIFDDINIQTEIERIRTRDEAITVLEHELIGEGKPYIIIDGKVWYSFGISGSTDPEGNKTNTFYPSANFISEDVTNFRPLNWNFSKDGDNVFHNYHIVQSANIDTFEPIGNTHYGKGKGGLYCGFNYVNGADISNGIIIISEENEIIRDSSNNIFYGHKKVVVEKPEELKNSCDNFFFDGVNVYLAYAGFYNITEKYNLKKGEDITSIEGDIYIIGDKKIIYKDFGIKVEDFN